MRNTVIFMSSMSIILFFIFCVNEATAFCVYIYMQRIYIYAKDIYVHVINRHNQKRNNNIKKPVLGKSV